MLSCSDCLARYSDYIDGVLDAESAEQWRLHLVTCPDCARYDRVLHRGLKLLGQQPTMELGADFYAQLGQRLEGEDRRAYTRPMTSLAAGSIAVAAMLAFAAWIPVLLLSDGNAPNAIAQESASAVAAEIAWHRESAVDETTSPHVHLARRLAWSPTSSGHVIEAKYTPVVLESPMAPPSYVRTYLSE